MGNASNKAELTSGGYSLCSDDRDDRRIFLGVVIGDLVFFRGCSRKIF